ncbi:MAG: ribonuclease PH [Candidatus Omnitrophica bacterium]|nr:ribonuclease PH [Candidatus Omnitrophota bacterium]
MSEIARQGGRAHDAMRPASIVLGVNKYAEGSCQIEMGDTKVLCTASVDPSVPPWLRGGGRGWITAEYSMLPRACTERTPRDAAKGKINGRSVEIQRLIGRSLRSVVNLKALGERCIWVDCDVLQGDGGTRCAAITGGFAALGQCLRGLQKAGQVPKEVLVDYVAAVSLGVVGGKIFADLDYAEDSSAEVDCNLVMTGSDQLVEVQGTGEQRPFSREELDQILRVGAERIAELIALQRKALDSIA